MKITRAIIYFILITVLFLHSFDSKATNVVETLSNIDGLTNNSVNCVFEDSEHTMWIGTWDGLNAYNGRDILKYRYSQNSAQSLCNNVVRQIIEHNKILWIATDGGINKLDLLTYQMAQVSPRINQNISNQEKSYSLGISKHGKILCLVRGIGLFFYSSEQDTFVPVNSRFAQDIRDFLIDSSDNILFLLNDGKVITIQLDKILNDKSSSYHSVYDEKPIDNIFFTGGRFILKRNKTLILLNHTLRVDHTCHIPVDKELSQVCYYKKNIYIGLIEGGCICYNTIRKEFVPLKELPQNISVFCLYMGSQDILWIGTDGQGLMKRYHYISPFHSISTSHPVRCFCKDNNGNLYIGTKGAGIKILKKRSEQISSFLDTSNGLISNSVYAMRRNRYGDIFVGTEGEGVQVIQAKTNKLLRISIPSNNIKFKAVYGICFTNADSTLWLATSGYGIIRMDIHRDSKGEYIVDNFRQYSSSDQSIPLYNDVVYAMVVDNNEQYLWFGSRGGGLYRINLSDDTMQSFETIHPDLQLTNNDITSLQYSNNVLWIGTSYGLNQLIDNSTLIQYADDVLKSKIIHGILSSDANNIWISTNDGISHLTLDQSTIDDFSVKDGLQNNEFSDGAFFKDSLNWLYFGGVNGFSYFDPGQIKHRSYIPILSLSNFKIYNTNYNVKDYLSDGILNLTYDERFVTFDFIAKDYIKNSNCEYAYRLKGEGDEWIDMGNNGHLVFTRLSPGKHVLQVKSTNGDKVWVDNIYTLTIVVDNPWWLSNPAIITYIVFSLILFYVIRSVIINRIRLSKQILIARVEQQHEQKNYEAKLNFFTNVAHEFFTPLTLIYTPAQHLLEQHHDPETDKYLRIIKNNADRMQRLINELMEFRKIQSNQVKIKPEIIHMNQVIQSVSDNYIDILKENKIDYNVIVDKMTKSFYSDANIVEKILFNLLSNAFKYTPSGGYIRVEATQSEDATVSFKVRNSGKGLTDQQMAAIFDRFRIFDSPKNAQHLVVSTGIGLNLTKNLTEHLGGTIDVRSEIGRYVEFVVILPSLSVSHNEVKLEITDSPCEKNKDKIAENKEITILVVEDESDIRKLLRDVFATYTVIETSNGLEALAEIEKNHPSVIVSDIVMPQMDGITLIERLKSDKKTSYIPIVCISAKNSIEDQIKAFNLGADAYLTKPFHPKQLISTIKNLLSRQSMLRDYFNSSVSSVKIKDGIKLHPEDELLIQTVTDFVNSKMDDETLNPNMIADFVGVSKATLYRKFKELLDKTPSEFIRGIRLKHAAKLLRTSKMTVSEIMYQCGFSNKSYFYREFSRLYGESPNEYRKK